MRPLILLFNYDEKKYRAVQLIALKMGMSVRAVTEDKFGLTLGDILEDRGTAPGTIPGEMLIMCNFLRGTMSPFVDELKKKKANTPIKAMLTETNSGWTAEKLYSELCAERDAILSGSNAHS